jgi:hypothetical protein
MQEWKSSFAATFPDFDLVFDRFETLASLAYFGQLKKDSVKAELENPQGFAWMPVGRFARNRKSRETILAEIEGNQAAVLLKAGFVKGDQEMLQLFVTNFRRTANLRF